MEPFTEFVITLLRLRLALGVCLLGDLFGTSPTRITQIFTTWITILSSSVTTALEWPSRRKVQKNMPRQFKKKYSKTRVIIDCTEFFIQKPRMPSAQYKTYSTYKSHNTCKALIGITPSGLISFVSKLWGGNVSDRHITKESGLLELLEKDDLVMADRGFVIRDLCLQKDADLLIPPFTRKCSWGKGKHLSVKEILATRGIARLRIHVERAIERIKNFSILSGTISNGLKPLLNQMVRVAAALCNLYKPLVKK